jgi:phosphoglycolate phosphatase-like HAD superfamily hydrolase
MSRASICLFDIDGTLLNSGGAGKAALESAFRAEFRVPLAHYVPYAGRTDRAIIRDLLRLHGFEDSPHNTRRLLDCYLSRLPDSLHANDGRVLPGIHRLLDRLRRNAGIHLGLLTGNVRAGARAKLSHYGLFEHFAFGGFGDEHFDRDDVAREALATARQHVGDGVPTERIWVIGDTPLDVRCARAIGARVIAVATGTHTVDQLAAARPDLVLPDLSDESRLEPLWRAD